LTKIDLGTEEESKKMTTETTTTTVDAGKRRKASAISGGLFLISLGILIWTGW